MRRNFFHEKAFAKISNLNICINMQGDISLLSYLIIISSTPEALV